MVPNPNKNFEIIYPENCSDIITKLMEKYGLKESAEEAIKKLGQGEITIGEKIAGIVAEAAESKFSLEKIASYLEEDLTISKDVAKKLAEDIKKEILFFVKKVPIEKEKIIPPEKKTGIPLPEKPSVEKLEIKPGTPPKTSPEKPLEKDIYREPIE